MYPILFEFGPFTLHSLWFFISIGFLIGSLVLSRIAKRNRMHIEFLSRHSFTLLLSALVSSRFIFILFHAESFFSSSETLFTKLFSLFRIWDKGLSFWGAVLGFFIALVSLANRERESLKKWMDIFAIPLLVALLFGHLGAFFDGMGHGRETLLPWGVSFQSAVVKYTVPVHPTQIYAALYTLAILFFITRVSGVWFTKYEGLTAKVGIFLYASWRFLEDFFRGDDTIMLFDVIRISQIIALGIAAYMGYRLWKDHEPPIVRFLVLLKLQKE